jgi:hypothetical protein
VWATANPGRSTGPRRNRGANRSPGRKDRRWWVVRKEGKTCDDDDCPERQSVIELPGSRIENLRVGTSVSQNGISGSASLPVAPTETEERCSSLACEEGRDELSNAFENVSKALAETDDLGQGSYIEEAFQYAEGAVDDVMLDEEATSADADLADEIRRAKQLSDDAKQWLDDGEYENYDEETLAEAREVFQEEIMPTVEELDSMVEAELRGGEDPTTNPVAEMDGPLPVSRDHPGAALLGTVENAYEIEQGLEAAVETEETQSQGTSATAGAGEADIDAAPVTSDPEQGAGTDADIEANPIDAGSETEAEPGLTVDVSPADTDTGTEADAGIGADPVDAGSEAETEMTAVDVDPVDAGEMSEAEADAGVDVEPVGDDVDVTEATAGTEVDLDDEREEEEAGESAGF